MNNSNKARLRQSKIRDLLLKKEVISIQEFCKILDVSIATIRNDLTSLEKQGLLKRVLGGAISCEGTPQNTGYHARINLYKEEKKRIAQYVVDTHIKKDMRITLDAGSTNHYIALWLLEKEIPCTIITNAFNVISLLGKSSFINLYSAGGLLDKEHNAYHDEVAKNAVAQWESDIYFLSPNGIDVEKGITSSAKEENEIKRVFAKKCKKVIVVADHSKFYKKANYSLMKCENVSEVVCDANENIDYKTISPYIKITQVK